MQVFLWKNNAIEDSKNPKEKGKVGNTIFLQMATELNLYVQTKA